MATLQQLRNKLRLLIDQKDSSNSDFTDAELGGLLNEAVIFFATQIKWPKDIIEIQVEEGKDTYTLPTDTLLILDSFFGNKDVENDMRRLNYWTPQILAEHRPYFLDNTTKNRGRPTVITLIDRRSVFLSPAPDAAESASGKKLHLYYVYYPDNMNADADEPDLPIAYHDHLPTYAAHICYNGKLKNLEMSKSLLNEAQQKIKLLEPPVTKETEIQNFAFGNYASFEDDSDTGIDPTL